MAVIDTSHRKTSHYNIKNDKKQGRVVEKPQSLRFQLFCCFRHQWGDYLSFGSTPKKLVQLRLVYAPKP
jgi:hypothetical protein